MYSQAVIAFLLILYLRKRLRTFSPEPEWDKRLTMALYAAVALFILEVFAHIGYITKWVWYVVVLLLIFVTYKRKEFFSARPAMVAVLPLVVIFFIKDVAEALIYDFYTSIETYFNFAVSIAATWMIAMFILSGRQQKALLKEQKKRAEEDEQNRLIAARKAELEELVIERTAAVTQQKEELEHALTDLKATQAQLVQREKMASLGELTAGVAHEIQNPLNFINNFSELNAELTAELTQEINSLPGATAAKQTLFQMLNDLQQNSQKIATHGKRADAIVKGMLQHSRKTTGTKELTDINALADEYLRLSYHGLRAKDKSFNATFKTDFDAGIGKMAIVPQDIGRVLLNLFNNAFYAVNEKKKTAGEEYKPMVCVSTRKLKDAIEIKVQDNGMGISKSLQDKIFQPFFTTKPTGQGTGLGLSLSYDIVKAHGGEINVESNEGEGAAFMLTLPVMSN